jgi:ABC-type multidrug transport system fused ATPase/permease subunit
MSSHIGNAIEMLDILSTPHEIKDIENAKNLQIQKGNIEFKNIGFLYNQDVKVFENFSLSIKS